MQFGNHIGKGIWAFADKALPAIYALGFIFLVIRTLPEQEYGSFALVQSVFLIVSSLGYALALQPLTKFAAETDDNGSYIVASLVVNAVFYVVVSIAVLLFKDILGSLVDASGQAKFSILVSYVPLLLLSSYYRSFAISLLQAKYQIQKIFWIDAAYFLGTFALIAVMRYSDRFHTAEDMIRLNVYGQGMSSLLAIVLTLRQLRVPLVARKEAFRKMWEFGKYSFGGSSLYTIFAQMDTFFVSHYVGIIDVALYNAAKNLTRVFDMLAQVLQMFLVPFSSKAYGKKEFQKMRVTAEKSICFSTLLYAPIFVLFFFFPEYVLSALYNGKYDGAANILRVFSSLAFIMPWNGVVVSYMIGCGKVKAGFYFAILLFLMSLPIYSLLTSGVGVTGPAIGYVGIMLCFTIVQIVYVRPFLILKPLAVARRTGDLVSFLSTKISSKS